MRKKQTTTISIDKEFKSKLLFVFICFLQKSHCVGACHVLNKSSTTVSVAKCWTTIAAAILDMAKVKISWKKQLKLIFFSFFHFKVEKINNRFIHFEILRHSFGWEKKNEQKRFDAIVMCISFASNWVIGRANELIVWLCVERCCWTAIVLNNKRSKRILFPIRFRSNRKVEMLSLEY